MKMVGSRMLRLICLLLICGAALAASPKSKPKSKQPISTYFTLCSRKDRTELNKCLKKTVMESIPMLAKGIPALNLVSMDPMVIPKMQLEESNGNFKLKTTFHNYVIKGLKHSTLDNVDIDLDDPKWNMRMVVPRFEMKADYEIDGQILILPIQGKGNCEMNFTNVLLLCNVDFGYIQKNSERFIQINQVNLDIRFNGDNSFWFYNLFNGAEELGNATNRFLNENIQEAAMAFVHLPEKAFGEVLKHSMNAVFSLYSTEELFVPSH